MPDVITKLRSLYAAPHPRRAQRLAALAPIAELARALRAQHAGLLLEHADLAHEVVRLDTRQLARYLEPPLLSVVGRLVEAAGKIARAGTTDDAMDAVYAAEALVDTPRDREFESAAAVARRDVELLVGAVNSLRASVEAMQALLARLDAVTSLAAVAVDVPKLAGEYVSEGQVSA